MLGLGDYGSGSESDDDVQTKPPTSNVKSQSLPKPSSRPPSSSSIAIPPPRTKKKKIAIALPSLKVAKDDNSDDDVQQPPAKKQRLESGAGLSSLLSMLPAPKQKNPLPAAPARVLGGGGGASAQKLVAEPVATESSDTTNSLPFLPPSLAKGRSNISLEDERPRKALVPSAAPAVDFFSLGSTSSPATSKPIVPSSSSSISISSAPAISTFEPPEPTPNDEYPGYYQLPSGQWAAHDAEYYNKFAKKWQREYDAHVRALEKGAGKGFEKLESSDIANVDAAQEMERAKKEIKEREDRKKISMGTDGEPAKPKMNINASKLSGIARSRHQLSTLLKEAYENREALEDRIAEGRRNRKEAGNKYGF
ncbi:mitotic checkpoint regulator, MAD2B-interacting-domain-containing protein [Mucidula mucida]|nr:mitotic checkpoint regulator, MAD2B-interacting-domain-containing protein [Mucidula mucida]